MPAKTPEEVDQLFEQYLNAANVDALVGLYEPGASFVQQGGEVITGQEAIRKELAGLAQMKPVLHCHVFKVVPAGGDLAVLYNDWSGAMTEPSGQKISISGKALEMVRRQADGTWRFVLDDPFARS